MIVIGVTKRAIHGKRAKKSAKRHTILYYYDDNSTKINTKRINFIQAIYYRLKKKHQIGTCPTCKRVFYSFFKKDIICPYCK